MWWYHRKSSPMGPLPNSETARVRDKNRYKNIPKRNEKTERATDTKIVTMAKTNINRQISKNMHKEKNTEETVKQTDAKTVTMEKAETETETNPITVETETIKTEK